MTLQEAAQQALTDICGARLCTVNSMSSRQEMLRLMGRAADTLRAALNQSPVKTYCGGKPNYVIPQTFSEWWDSDEMAHFNPYEEDTPIFWAWEGWQANVFKR